MNAINRSVFRWKCSRCGSWTFRVHNMVIPIPEQAECRRRWERICGGCVDWLRGYWRAVFKAFPVSCWDAAVTEFSMGQKALKPEGNEGG